MSSNSIYDFANHSVTVTILYGCAVRVFHILIDPPYVLYK